MTGCFPSEWFSGGCCKLKANDNEPNRKEKETVVRIRREKAL